MLPARIISGPAVLVLVSVSGAAPAIGPTVSGLILQFLPWRFVFVLVLPIALAILVVGLRQVPNLNEPVMVKLDAISVPLAGLGFGGLVYGLSLVGSPTAGWWLEAALIDGDIERRSRPAGKNDA